MRNVVRHRAAACMRLSTWAPLPVAVSARRCCDRGGGFAHDASGNRSAQCAVTAEAAMTGAGDKLTAEMAAVLALALDGASLFIGGKAGTGKSFLLRQIVYELRRRHGLRVAVTAATGIAALNVGGNTYHSTLGALVELDRCSDTRADWHFGHGHCPPPPSRAARVCVHYDTDVLGAIDVLVVDEVSMLHAGYLESLERAARRAAGRDGRRPFGGLQVILAGDFMQLTPFTTDAAALAAGPHPVAATHPTCSERIVCKAVQMAPVAVCSLQHDDVGEQASRAVSTRRHALAAYINERMFESYVFQNHLLHLQLRQPARQAADVDFLADLDALRRGVLTHRLSRSALLNAEDPTALRLFATRRAVRMYNERQTAQLTGETCSFRSRLQFCMLPAGATTPPLRARHGGGAGDDTKANNISSEERRRRFGCNTRLARAGDSVLLCFARTASSKGDAWHVHEAVQSALLAICAATKLSRRRLRHCVLPARPAVSCSLRWVVVRFAATRRRRCVMTEQQRFVQAAMAYMHAGCAQSAARVWRLVRCQRYSARQIDALVQPALHRRFSRVIRDDFVLRSKELKTGCRVLLLRNLNARYVNGSLGTIVDFRPLADALDLLPRQLKVSLPLSHTAVLRRHARQGVRGDDTAARHATRRGRASSAAVVVPIVRMDGDGAACVAIPWITLPLPPLVEGWSCNVICMPLTPAYAFTVHKVQGITFEHNILFDASDMFASDHIVYVAASRVRRFSQLRMINLSPRMISVHRPSLLFSDRLPDAATATRRWRRWRAGQSSERLFLPAWLSPPSV